VRDLIAAIDNSAHGGKGGKDAGAGSGYGGAMFNLDGSVTMIVAHREDNTVTPGAGGEATQQDVYSLACGNNIRTGEHVSAQVTVDKGGYTDKGFVFSVVSKAIAGKGKNTVSEFSGGMFRTFGARTLRIAPA